MKVSPSLGGGLAGAIVLTAIHEIVRKIDPDAPRMDLMGMDAISKLLKKEHRSVPPDQELFLWTMAGDVISNALFYSIAGVGRKHQLQKGLALGISAGLGAILLPKRLGLNEAPSNRTLKTKLMTVGIYLAGGLAASAVMKWMGKRRKK